MSIPNFSQLFVVVLNPEWYTESSFELFMSAKRLISASERRTIMELFFILGGGLLIILFAVVVAVIVSVAGAMAAENSDLE